MNAIYMYSVCLVQTCCIVTYCGLFCTNDISNLTICISSYCIKLRVQKIEKTCHNTNIVSGPFRKLSVKL